MVNNDEEKKTPLMGYFSDEMVEKIKEYAEREKRSVSNSISYLVLKGLEREE